jgi:hypothetical protein
MAEWVVGPNDRLAQVESIKLTRTERLIGLSQPTCKDCVLPWPTNTRGINTLWESSYYHNVGTTIYCRPKVQVADDSINEDHSQVGSSC